MQVIIHNQQAYKGDFMHQWSSQWGFNSTSVSFPFHVVYKYVILEAAVLQNILKIISYNFFKYLFKYIYTVIVVRNKKTFFALKTDNSLFCHLDITTIQNSYCVSNAVDYAKKNDVLPTICQLNAVVSNLNI